MRVPLCLTALAILTLSATAAPAQTSWTDADKPGPAISDEPRITVVENVRMTATVGGIDKGARTLQLLYPDGFKESVKIGSEVRNFDQIEVGDTVMAEYDRVSDIYLRPPLSGSSATAGVSLDRAEKGEKPRATAVQTMEVTAIVEGVDLDARKITLRGPQGNSRTVQVPADAQGLEDVKVGNEVVIRQTEAVAAAVTK